MTIAQVTAVPEIWETAVVDWPRTRGHRLLRDYGDTLNGRLAQAWLGVGSRARRLLKTDLFDEAVGEGVFPYLAELADEVQGIDVSEAVVAAASRRYPALESIQADIRRLPFADASFDVITSFSTLDHFDGADDLDAGLGELARVLAPEGRLLVTLDNAANPLVALRNTLPERWLQATRLVPCHVGTTCGRKELDRKLAAHGLSVECRATVMHVPRVAALGAAAVWPRGHSLLSFLLAGERLGALPTRSLTGQFVAALAVKRA